MKIPETNEILNTGLRPGKPYLGSPVVVEDVVREYLADLNEIRTKQVSSGVDPVPLIQSCADRLQDTFYGKSDRFQVSAWHREKSLGKALVEGAGIGGDTSDAVSRVGLRIAKEFYRDLIAYEDGRIADEAMKSEVNKLVSLYVRVFLGGNEDRF